MGPEDAAQHYERIRMMAEDDERFTFTGVKDAARIDSYYDPFGNLSIEQRARLEIARESYKGGRVEAAEGMRTHLLLEDLSATHTPPEGALPPPLPQYERLVAGLAAIHATWWEHPRPGP